MTTYDDDMDESADPESHGPREDDWQTQDHVHFYQNGRCVLTLQIQTRPGSAYRRDAQEGELSDSAMWRQITAEMTRRGGAGAVWFVSDHGNAHLMTRPKRKNYRKAKREAVGQQKAQALIAAAEKKYGTYEHGHLISGGFYSHWPDRVKEKIRTALHGKTPARRSR